VLENLFFVQNPILTLRKLQALFSIVLVLVVSSAAPSRAEGNEPGWQGAQTVDTLQRSIESELTKKDFNAAKALLPKLYEAIDVGKLLPAGHETGTETQIKMQSFLLQILKVFADADEFGPVQELSKRLFSANVSSVNSWLRYGREQDLEQLTDSLVKHNHFELAEEILLHAGNQSDNPMMVGAETYGLTRLSDLYARNRMWDRVEKIADRMNDRAIAALAVSVDSAIQWREPLGLAAFNLLRVKTDVAIRLRETANTIERRYCEEQVSRGESIDWWRQCLKTYVGLAETQLFAKKFEDAERTLKSALAIIVNKLPPEPFDSMTDVQTIMDSNLPAEPATVGDLIGIVSAYRDWPYNIKLRDRNRQLLSRLLRRAGKQEQATRIEQPSSDLVEITRLGKDYIQRKMWGQANEVADKLIELAGAEKNPNTIAAYLRDLANSASNQPQHEIQTRIYQTLLSIDKKAATANKDSSLVDRDYMALAKTQIDDHNFTDAESTLRNYLDFAIAMLPSKPLDFSADLKTILASNFSAKRYNEAFSFTCIMRGDARLGAQRDVTLELLTHVAWQYQLLGQNSKADEIYKRGLSLMEKDHRYKLLIWGIVPQYAAFLRKTGKLEEADRMVEKYK